MSNSKKLEQDAAKHRGFEKSISDGVHPVNMGGFYTKPNRKEINEALRQHLLSRGLDPNKPAIAEMMKFALDNAEIDQEIMEELRRKFAPAHMDFGPPPGAFEYHIEVKRCQHTNKRKEGIHKLFWVCNDCKKDLGDV
jgi:hypothetical protein